MKKKNVLMMALSLCLVAVVAIGGTLAYLTATPDEVTNTFAFVTGFDDGDGVINVKVEESLPKEGLGDAEVEFTRDGDNNITGIAYTDVVPNQILPKEPVISTKAKVESWVFVRITEGNVTILDMSDEWTRITDASLPDGTSVYAYHEPVAATEGTDYVELDTLFTKVQVTNDNDATLEPIKIEVAAVQTGITDDAGEVVTTVQDVYDEVGVNTLFTAA